MMSKDGDGRAELLSLGQDRTFQIDTAQIEAKALLSEVAEELPAYNWNYIPQRVVRNAVLAVLDLEQMALTAPQEVAEVSRVASKVATTWESLAKLREGADQNIALLNAALSYELAGYQANAAYVASRLTLEDDRHGRPTLMRLFSSFVQRRFLRSLQLAAKAQTKPDFGEQPDVEVAEALAVAAAARGLFEAVRFFLRGERDRVWVAADWLARAERGFALLSLPEEANLARGLRSLLPMMERRSTWVHLSDKALGHAKWQRYLKLLAHGTGSDVLEGRSISELWPSQIAALESGLLNSTSSKIVKMPTSAGKTRIAEMAIVHTLVNDPLSKCVYVAPYRALASELEQSLSSLLSDLGYRVSSVTGAFETDEFEELLFRLTDVLITTPEKLDLLLRARPDLVDDIKLFVLDEAHVVAENRRGVKYEMLLTRLKRRLPESRFLTLSAVVPQQTLEEFAAWLGAGEEDVVVSSWRPTIQRYAKFEWKGASEGEKTGTIRYATSREDEVLQGFVPGVIDQRTFAWINESTGRRNRKRFPESGSKAETAAELAFKFAELGPVLVFCSQRRYAEAVANALHRRLQLVDRSEQTMPPYFGPSGRTRAAMLADEWLGDRPITTWIKSGIGIHYGTLPDVIRKAVETDFRERKLRVLIATSTLAQGVNLPVKTVLFHSCWRHEDGRPVRVSARDYWNVAGRAGRAGEETEDLVVHVKLTDQDERDYRYYLGKRDRVDPIDGALFQRLVDLAQNRLSEDALKADLDSEILALMVEETSTLHPEEIVEDVMNGSLVNV